MQYIFILFCKYMLCCFVSLGMIIATRGRAQYIWYGTTFSTWHSFCLYCCAATTILRRCACSAGTRSPNPSLTRQPPQNIVFVPLNFLPATYSIGESIPKLSLGDYCSDTIVPIGVGPGAVWRMMLRVGVATVEVLGASSPDFPSLPATCPRNLIMSNLVLGSQ